MKSKNLLSQLSDLEATLSNFSFEELSAADAVRLKKSFEVFKGQLESRIWGEDTTTRIDYNPDTTKEKERKHGQNGENTVIATVSHEIRTPLNGIIGFTDLLKEGLLTEEQTQYVSAIQSASNALLGIINELLEYSKLSSGLEHFEMVAFNFYSIIKEVTYLCNTLILDKAIKLEVEMDTEIPKDLIGDPSKLSQILLNLLGNSIKFVEKGNIFLKIKLKKETSEALFLEFEITDTGIGISAQDLKHIFEPFKQVEHQIATTKYKGSGLGLSIVKQIIEKLNGEINVESSVGVGTTFKFTLPYTKGRQEVLPENKNSEMHPEEIKGMCILVFEDNLLNQRLIEERLKAWGCKSYITENAVYGLNVLENNKIDVVLMDLRMPVMNGFEVTQRIRESKKAAVREVPVIALTADFTIEDKDECNKNGINDYILKPYSPEELLSKLLTNKKNMDTIVKLESAAINAEQNEVKENPKVDFTIVLEECLGEISLLEELVRLYKQNALEFIGQVKLHLKHDDFEGITFAAHKIKSGLKMMRSHELYSLVEQIHSTSKTNKDIKHLTFLFNCFVEEYPFVEKVIDSEMKKLKK